MELLEQLSVEEMQNLIGFSVGWQVSGLNIHRSPFSGRNFEYYPENPFLSGRTAAAEIAAIQSKGVHRCMKRLALNGQGPWAAGPAHWRHGR